MHEAVRKTAEQLFVPLTVGGGIRTFEDVRKTLNVGADKTSINTAAVLDPSLISRCADAFGSQCVVLAIDAKRSVMGGLPTPYETDGSGCRRMGEGRSRAWRRGILLTSMDSDGMKKI
jgi:cyclase